MILPTSLFEPMPVVVSASCSFRGLVRLRSVVQSSWLMRDLTWAPFLASRGRKSVEKAYVYLALDPAISSYHVIVAGTPGR